MAAAADAALPAAEFYRRLPDYLARLRAEGIGVDTQQEARLALLLARLESRGGLPATVAAFARIVVPLLAGTPAQQALCHDHFAATFGDGPGPADPAHEKQDRGGEAEERKAWFRRMLQLVVARGAAIAAVALAVGLSVFIYVSIEMRRDQSPPSAAPEIPPERFVGGAMPDWIMKFPIKELEPPEQSIWNRTARWYYTEYDWKKTLAAGWPWLLFAATFGGLVYLTLAHLRRESLRQNLKSLPFSFRGDRPRFGDRSLVADLQPLRQLARDEIRELSPEETALATAASGGLLSPRFTFRPVPADFVTLIDRRSSRDHLAAYGDSLVETLRGAGLFVEQFDFDRAPWICQRRRGGETETLRGIVTSFPGAVFLIFIPARELVDPGTGGPRAWFREIEGEGNVFFIVPEPEAAALYGWLMPPGASLVPATPDGLRRLAAALLVRKAPKRAPEGASRMTSLVASLNERADRWSQDTPPPVRETDALVDDLRKAAGADAFRWLAATSVYPELRWPMTLYLRDRLTARPGLPARMGPDVLGVAQLPWFRRGWMPEWLRSRMLARLTSDDRRRVRSLILDAMGLSRQSGRPDASMEMSSSRETGPRPPDRVRADRILVDYLLPSLTSKNQLFAVPEDWARRIARKPLRRLAFAGVVGALLAAAGSIASLSQMPISECDLWGSSQFQSDRIGPGRTATLMERGGYLDRVIAACARALENDPDNKRFLYQYTRAFASKPDLTPAQIDGVRAILDMLSEENYSAALNEYGYHLNDGIFGNDLPKALEYHQRAYDAGALEALTNIAIIYEYDEFNEERYHLRRREILERHYREGGVMLWVLAFSYRDGKFGFPEDHAKYVEIVREGVAREDSESAAELGYLSEIAGALCEQCEPDHEAANELFRAAIRWGADDYAAYALAWNYHYGLGVEQNFTEALHWAIFAARMGESRAIDLIYDVLAAAQPDELDSAGVRYATVIAQLTPAAEAGDMNAQYRLGLVLEAAGRVEEALGWYRLAAAQGHVNASLAVERLDGDAADR